MTIKDLLNLTNMIKETEKNINQNLIFDTNHYDLSILCYHPCVFISLAMENEFSVFTDVWE